jgi:nitroreductase
MDFFDLIQKRQSIRTFRDKQIPDDDIEKIIKAAIRAPSAGNLQGYEIIVVKDDEDKQALAKAALDQDSGKEASICLVFCANPARSAHKYGERGADLYCMQDATIATAYAQLAVAELGYGSVWVGAFEDKAVHAVLKLNDNFHPVSILPIGYANEEPERKSRRKFNDIVHNP